MKISEQWLRQWVNPNNSSEQLADQLTMAGLEIDDRFAVARAFSGVVVGEVISVEQHPDADKLRVTQVNIGAVEPLQIVCGAPNVTVGMKVPVATVGAVLPSDDGTGFKIKNGNLRGVDSNGMLCGASEIDLTDNIDGLLELPTDAPIGTDIREYLGLDNQILDISITPNRGDCFSVRGIAREISVINDLPLQMPNIPDNNQVIHNEAMPAVTVSAVEACPRYFLQSISNIDRTIDTPKWMQDALVQSGLRSHNFLVDVTNYVLMELGQPLHAFDADTIVGDIVVRLAQPEETITLLNEQTISLTGDELVIADDKGALALAGIMGGQRSSVTDSTTNIVLESAFFNPLAIAARARRFGLHTDASQRFERGVDFELPALALARAVDLITSVTGSQAGQIVAMENSDHLPARAPITLPITKVRDVIGIEIEPVVMVRILTQLGFKVEQQADSLICTPPSYRFDMSIKEDLIEEIARIYGYDNIPSILPHLQVSMDYDDTADLTHEMKLALVDNGYMEAISFSFSDAKLEALLDDKALGEVLALANPISSDLAVMRRTLLSSLLPCVQYNLNRQQSRVRFFETGLSFVGHSVSDLVQTPSIAIVAVGDVWDEQAYQNRALDFYDLKHDIEQLLPAKIDNARIRYERSQLAFLHPGQSAKLYIDDQYVGWLGQLHPNTAKQLDLTTTWVAQLSLAPLLTLAREQHAITTPSKFPQVRRDIAILVDSDISLQTLESTIRKASGTLLTDLWLFDVYQGEKVPAGQRSLAFALIWQDKTQTLSDDAVKTATDKVVQALTVEHSAQLRDS
ncbi:phenylalanyl-tRNA synthetase beta subunit [Psychrobacter arcticus 273-4]|uniref:Phenylalanine--tRNA ligase beta subunit n=1 Tax=Psychrobacter arcticus (strain DSM 17307 / VKM B-2377 / 273-4) TaxID=259536 RepID=SYFB_PSYA2|nr:phenylalanine--tRNA ligase subunit beta [Psychrobacter arcticus]Q4FQ66.1 RecName: Full=Phenylalanine--tRNA ligase beta subunit; AltName: Full=Phenylalanyl-tRNA synthetase beta subunit; Short=PheRS [Psychrobacter arcticus 273-4]AAZ19842.1 phenylalanyl-tRNA synthetase beta subunit [Psychrobacter arcticus 273-4]